MDELRTDVDEFFDGEREDFAPFAAPTGQRHTTDDGFSWWDKDENNLRISALHSHTAGGGGFGFEDASGGTQLALDAARSGTDLAALPLRQIWAALSDILSRDAFEDGTLIANGKAAARLANDVRRRLLADKQGTIEGIWGDHPWPTDTGVRLGRSGNEGERIRTSRTPNSQG